jgi:peptidoglycan-associated lipoprotein
MKHRAIHLMVIALTLAAIAACGGRRPPVANQPPPPDAPSPFPTATAPPTPRPPDPPPIPTDAPVTASSLLPWNDKPLEEINGPNSPLRPIFFAYDSDQVDDAAKKTLAANAEVLRTYATWVITIEGHCDERGTAEYNLALGDRRALSARTYLISLGIPADRMRTVSYGKEFPFDPGHAEDAWEKNRRAHFMLTSK